MKRMTKMKDHLSLRIKWMKIWIPVNINIKKQKCVHTVTEREQKNIFLEIIHLV